MKRARAAMSKYERIEEMFDSALKISRINVPDTGFKLLLTHFALLEKWNVRFNLTSLADPKDIIDRLYVDSLLFGRSIPGKACRVLDIGSGPGFPGIPMLAIRPDMDLILVEPRHKMASFLSEVMFALKDSTQFRYEQRRSDDPELLAKYSGKVPVVVSKAFASPGEAFQSVKPLLCQDGIYITCLNPETPLENPSECGFELVDEKTWILPLTGRESRHLIFRPISPAAL